MAHQLSTRGLNCVDRRSEIGDQAMREIVSCEIGGDRRQEIENWGERERGKREKRKRGKKRRRRKEEKKGEGYFPSLLVETQSKGWRSLSLEPWSLERGASSSRYLHHETCAFLSPPDDADEHKT